MAGVFRDQIKAGDLLIGTLVTLASPEVTEIMVETGFDWLFIDCEHAPFEAQTAQALLQAAGDRCPCAIRVPSGDEVWIKKGPRYRCGRDHRPAGQFSRTSRARRAPV